MINVIMAVIDTGMLQNDDELSLKINSTIKNMSSEKKSSFQCEFCDKVCLSSGGLTRNVTKKHSSSKVQEPSSSDCLVSDLILTAEIKSEPIVLKGFFKKSILKLAQNECYPDVTLGQRSNERGTSAALIST